MSRDEYVRAVLNFIPPASPERGRIEADLRMHLAESVEAGSTEAEAVSEMGSPLAVAEAYLEQASVPLASVLQRVAAFFLDFLLGLVALLAVAGLAGLLFVSASVATDALGWAEGMAGILFVSGFVAVALLSVLYFPVLETLYGQTLGKRVMGIYVAKESGTHIRALDAIVRRLPFFFEFFWLDALFVFFTEKRQRAFDMVAKTIVLRVR